ncbi:hypothetical protein [Flavobacterium sp. GCM10027622]|uniref:hypothetical protein n=1 Tax=unclassified Flavobacterium TaxID=196869 RepID=UPI0036088997
MENNSPWRIVLSVCLILFAVFRIATRCSNSSRSNSYDNSVQSNQDQISTSLRMINEQISKTGEDVFNDSYTKISTLDSIFLDQFSIQKLNKDTLVHVDLLSKIRIPKEAYLQNTHDDSLRFGSKFKDDVTLLVHDFESKSKAEENLKQLKNHSDFKVKPTENNSELGNYMEYSFSKNDKKVNGFAYSHNDDEYQLFIEFESDRLSEKEIKAYALHYLKENLVVKNTKL